RVLPRRRLAPLRPWHVPLRAAEHRARLPSLRRPLQDAQHPRAERRLHRRAAELAPSPQSRRTYVRVLRMVDELPERLLASAEWDVVHPVRDLQLVMAGPGPIEVAVLPDDPLLPRVDDDDAVVEVVVDRDVPI